MNAVLPPTKPGAVVASPSDVASIHCTLAFAVPARQWYLALHLPAGATAAQALESARRWLAADFAQAGCEPPHWERLDCGIFGQPCAWSQVLQQGDRIEVYRPLQADPRTSRRSRVQAGRRLAGK